MERFRARTRRVESEPCTRVTRPALSGLDGGHVSSSVRYRRAGLRIFGSMFRITLCPFVYSSSGRRAFVALPARRALFINPGSHFAITPHRVNIVTPIKCFRSEYHIERDTFRLSTERCGIK